MCDHSRDRELPLILTSYITFGMYPFLVFKTLDPLPRNDDNRQKTNIIMMSIVLLITGSTCIMVFFTDTIQV